MGKKLGTELRLQGVKEKLEREETEYEPYIQKKSVRKKELWLERTKIHYYL